jgi:putative FmdB family regulatory protein
VRNRYNRKGEFSLEFPKVFAGWRRSCVPNYEYKCKTCEHRFEIWQTVGEAPPPCPECGAEVKKIFHAPPLHFKGSGFYVTDKAAEKKAKPAAKASDSSAESASETKSDTKPDAAGTSTTDKTATTT